MPIITAAPLMKTLRARPVETGVFSVAALGAVIRGTCGFRNASGAIQTTRTGTTGFAVTSRQTPELVERFAK